MIIKSIKLENIRSYKNQKIDFNNGVVVLSGDIGSGKSSILLAIEFALFGFSESGSNLLRKGNDEGSVELQFEVNNQKYTIKRFLKKKSDGIRQTNGYIIKNDMKIDMTPIELKQAIITILGYPQESLNKKSLIYRYTTYTPQDEMKQILYEDNEERINIIRKIFGIDKYSRIIDNSAIITKNLRENKRELLGRISDLESKKMSLMKLNDEKINLMQKAAETDIKFKEAKENLDDKRKKLFILESELKKVHELKREKAMAETEIKNKEEQILHLRENIEKEETAILTLKEKANSEKLSELKVKIKENLREDILEIEKEQLILQKQTGELEAMKNHFENTKKKIFEMEDCPLCLQKVRHEHKESIKVSEETKISESENKLSEINKKLLEIKQKLFGKNGELRKNNEIEREISIMNLHIKNISEKEASLSEKKTKIINLTEDVSKLKEKLQMIKISSFEEKEKEFEMLKKEFEMLQQIERNVEIEKTRTETEIKNSEKHELMLKKEIDDKEKSKEKINDISIYESWIENNFIKIISMMEKHVLSAIYHNFNESFKNMFEILIEDERMVSRIDENFSPVIEQNGHETEFENLSGGEKTSVSLAYRLALHKAITDVISNIQTKGLLILDEPTDGFSSEQIDKMKDLFEKLNTNQTIIVSHENKIESLADHIIRIAKNSHESFILA